MRWLLSLVALALSWACNDAQTAVMVEIRSDVEVTRVDVEIRDGGDVRTVDRFSFDSSASSKYRVPFSFRVVPGEESAAEFVLRARGYSSDELVSEAKKKVAFVQRETRHQVVKLTAACRDGQCDVDCDPTREQCEVVVPEGGRSGSSAGDGADRDASSTRNDGGAPGTGGAGSGGDAAPGGRDPVNGAPQGTGGQPPTGVETSSTSGGGGESGASGVGAMAGANAGGSGAAGASGSPAAGSGGAGASGSRAGAGRGGAGTVAVTRSVVLSGKDYTADVTYLGQAYVVRNGVDGSGFEQSISYQNTSITVLSVSGTFKDGTSWPAVFYGHLYGKASMNTVLPRRIDAIRGIDVSFKSNAGSVPGTYALVTALWFGLNTSRVDNNVPTAGLVEVWHNVSGSMVPDGTRIATSITVQGISGTYDLYEEDCFFDGQTCVTYVRNPPETDFAGDLRSFVNDAMSRAPAVLGSWQLNAIITGFAIEQNGAGLQLNEFTASVH